MKFLKRIHNNYFISQFNKRNTFQKIAYDQIFQVKPCKYLKKEKFSKGKYTFQEPLNMMDLMHGKYSMEHRILYDYIVKEDVLLSSLSKLLYIFPQLGGRLIMKNQEVLNDFSNSNFELLVVKSKENFNENDLNKYMMRVPIQSPFSLNTPLFTVTLTHFEKEKKSLISIYHSHVLLDGTAFSNLLENWSKIDNPDMENLDTFFQGEEIYKYENNGSKTEEYPLFYKYDKTIGHFLMNLEKNSHQIDENKIKDIKQRIKTERSVDVSTNDILSSVLFKSFSYTKPQNETVSIHCPVNGRRFISLPNHYIGNCMFHVKLKGTCQEIQNMHIDDLIIKFRDTISKMTIQNLYDFLNLLDEIKKKDPTYKELINFPSMDLMNTLIVTNVQMMNPFNLDFGQGGPTLFIKPCYDIGRIHLIHKKTKDSLVVNYPLPKSESSIFQQNLSKYL